METKPAPVDTFYVALKEAAEKAAKDAAVAQAAYHAAMDANQAAQAAHVRALELVKHYEYMKKA